MNVLIENQFCNLGVITRISNILLAKMMMIVTAYSAVEFGAFVTSAWFLFPVLMAAYLLFTGLTGWDPVIAFDQYLISLKNKQDRANDFTAFVR